MFTTSFHEKKNTGSGIIELLTLHLQMTWKMGGKRMSLHYVTSAISLVCKATHVKRLRVKRF